MFNHIVSVYETLESPTPTSLLSGMMSADSEVSPKFTASPHVLASNQRQIRKFEVNMDMGSAEPDDDDPVKSAELLTEMRNAVEAEIPGSGYAVIWLEGPLFVRRRDGVRAFRAVVSFVKIA